MAVVVFFAFVLFSFVVCGFLDCCFKGRWHISFFLSFLRISGLFHCRFAGVD